MIGVVVVAHAPLAAALVACAQHVYGQVPTACRAIDVAADSDVELQRSRCEQAIASIDSGAGVLVLVDLFGATPANIAAPLAKPGRVEVIAGVNLPMLLRVLCYRDSLALSAMTEKAIAGGASGILKIASVPPQDQQRAPPGPDDGNARLQDQQ